MSAGHVQSQPRKDSSEIDQFSARKHESKDLSIDRTNALKTEKEKVQQSSTGLGSCSFSGWAGLPKTATVNCGLPVKALTPILTAWMQVSLGPGSLPARNLLSRANSQSERAERKTGQIPTCQSVLRPAIAFTASIAGGIMSLRLIFSLMRELD